MTNKHVGGRPTIPRLIRALSVPILLIWLGVTVVFNVVVPQLDVVGQERSVSMSPADAPSLQATERVGKEFQEFDSDSSAMIVLESDQPLGPDAHQYYDGLMKKLSADTKHVEHVQDFWSDPLTASGSQSADGRAAYVQLYLGGNQGTSLGNESVEAIRNIVAEDAPPPGLKAYVTGASPLTSDQHAAGDKSLTLITVVTIGIIAMMLLLVYRSITTVLLILFMVFVELAAARGVVAFLGYYSVITLSTFAVNLLTMLAIAAGTDYAIFLVGRYQEARQFGEDREAAYYTMYHGTAHVIVGSGLTVAGATFCLTFTRLPYFQTLGIPLAIGMLVVVSAALTMGASVAVVASRFGLLDPKRAISSRGWRRVGTAIVRWPKPILVAALALVLVGLLALPGFKSSFDDRKFLPPDIPANLGYQAADRHFAQSRLNPELLLLTADHDLRNPADMLVVDRVAKAVFHIKGIARVQTITRPLGTPIEHTSIPFQISMQGTTQQMNQTYQQDRSADMLVQADQMQGMIDNLEHMLGLMDQLTAITHDLTAKTQDLGTTTNDLRDHIADFDDTFRPLRNYFYWEPHCFDIPLCWSIRSLFDSLDGVDTLSDQVGALTSDVVLLDKIVPQLSDSVRTMIPTLKTMKNMTLTNYATQKGLQDQQAALQKNATAMGQAFDASKNDDSFYLPPEVFDNADFKRGLKQFVSPDGKSVRFIVTHEGDPASAQGISKIDEIKDAAFEAIKGTPMETSKVFLGGTSATYKDMQDGSNFDLLIAAIASLCLIFIVMLVITRAVVASLVIVGTVLLSLGASFGVSVLLWQYIIGMELHWLVPGMSVIILLAVGSDYNLLLISRMKEEVHAGFKTGIIRSMGGTGSVVTNAGLVFAFTMMSMAVSDLRVIAQVGHDHRPGSAVRHAGRPVVPHTLRGDAARPLVLVAPELATPPSASRARPGGVGWSPRSRHRADPRHDRRSRTTVDRPLGSTSGRGQGRR